MYSRINGCLPGNSPSQRQLDSHHSLAHITGNVMKVIFVADLHYALKQFDWLVQNAASFDAVIIGGDLLDLGSDLHLDVQIVVVEKYLRKLREKSLLMVTSGNHDGDARN